MRRLFAILFVCCFYSCALHAQELLYKLGGTQKEDGQSFIKIFTLDPKKYKDEPRRLFFEKIDVEKPFLKIGNLSIDIKKLSTLDTHRKAITLAAFNNTDTPIILLQDVFMLLQVEILNASNVWRPLNYHYQPECLVNSYYQIQPGQIAIIKTKSLNGAIKANKRVKIATCPFGVVTTTEFASSYDSSNIYIPQSDSSDDNIMRIEKAIKPYSNCEVSKLRIRNTSK